MLFPCCKNQKCIFQSYKKFHSSKSSKGDSTKYSSSKKTHFGYQDVSEKEKHENGKYTTAQSIVQYTY